MPMNAYGSALLRPLSWPLVLLLLATGCAGTKGVSPRNSADPAESLSRRDWGKTVEVTLSGRTVSGALVAVDESALYIRPSPENPIVVVPRDQIALINIKEEPRWLDMAAFLGIVGVALGGVFLAWALSGEWDRN